MPCEDDRREQLDPVGDELAVVGLADLAGLGVVAEAMGSVAGDPGCPHVGGAGADRLQGFGNCARNELVVAGSLRPLAPGDLSLAVLAGAMPGLLARQELGEHVRFGVLRQAPITLAAVTGLAVGAVELDPRSGVLGVRALHPRCADPGHAPKVPPHSDG